MKTLSAFKKAVLLALMALVSFSCIHAVDAVTDIPTVVTFATADPNFSTLASALANLTPATDFPVVLSRTEGMNGDGYNPNFTVFAPTNAAFYALASIPGEAVLTQVLLHHVIGDNNVRSGDLTPNGVQQQLVYKATTLSLRYREAVVILQI